MSNHVQAWLLCFFFPGTLTCSHLNGRKLSLINTTGMILVCCKPTTFSPYIEHSGAAWHLLHARSVAGSARMLAHMFWWLVSVWPP